MARRAPQGRIAGVSDIVIDMDAQLSLRQLGKRPGAREWVHRFLGRGVRDRAELGEETEDQAALIGAPPIGRSNSPLVTEICTTALAWLSRAASHVLPFRIWLLWAPNKSRDKPSPPS